jgi:shikimate kinase
MIMPIGEMQRIVLVGRSGAGKSTLGPFLARSLGYSFVDMDEAVLARFVGMQAGMPERKKLMADLLDRSAIVVASGCEDFYEELCRDEILAKALSIWIIADTAGRYGKTVRVSSPRLSRDEEAATFRAADLHVDTRGLSVFEAVGVLVDHVRAVAARVNLSHLRRYEIGRARERPYVYFSDQANVGDRARQILENGICWQVIDTFLSEDLYRSAYVAYHGVWHSEGRKMALISADPRFATLEIFFFEHGVMPWKTSIVVHRDNGHSARLQWRSDAASPDEIEADLLQQLVNATGGRPMPGDAAEAAASRNSEN